MTLPVAEIKLSVDVLSRLFRFIKGISKTKKEKTILSNLYRELLLGDHTDFSKIESMLMQLEKTGADSPEYLKAREYFSRAKSAKPAAKSAPTVTAGKKKAGARKSAPPAGASHKKTGAQTAKPSGAGKTGSSNKK